jgi:hypothetical protein
MYTEMFMTIMLAVEEYILMAQSGKILSCRHIIMDTGYG